MRSTDRYLEKTDRDSAIEFCSISLLFSLSFELRKVLIEYHGIPSPFPVVPIIFGDCNQRVTDANAANIRTKFTLMYF